MQKNQQSRKSKKWLKHGVFIIAVIVAVIQNPSSLFGEDPTESTTEVSKDRVEVELIDVIDGDTVKIKMDGEQTLARLLLIDTPETSTTKTGNVQPYGKEATTYLNSLLKDKNISVEFEPSHQIVDDYDRYLVYMFADDQLIQESMLLEGFARLGYENTKEKYYNRLLEAEEAAEIAKKNIWSVPGYVQEYGFSEQ